MAAVVAAYIPLLARLAQRLWQAEHYQFFPLVLAAVAWLMWKRTLAAPPRQTGAVWLRVSSSLLALVTLALAVILRSQVIAASSAMIAILAIAYHVGGREYVRTLLIPWLLLWFIVPMPLGLDMQLIQSLQLLATSFASQMLDLFGVRHVVTGVVVQLPGHAYLVEEACSGIHSLFAATFCAAWYLISKERRWFKSLVVLASTVAWVLAVNALRVTLITILDSRWSLPVADGIGHDLVGFVSFAVILGLMVSTDHLMLFLIPDGTRLRMPRWKWLRRRKRGSRRSARRSEVVATGSSRRETSSPTLRPSMGVPKLNWDFMAVSALFLLLAVGQIATGALAPRAPDRFSSLAQLRDAGEDVLPAEWNGWRRVSFESIRRKANDPNGGISHVWKYQKGNRTIGISVDGPFLGWHSLASCLQGQGWKIHTSDNVSYRSVGFDLPAGFTEVQVQQGTNRHAMAVFATFDDMNRPVPPPETYAAFRVVRRFPGLAESWRRLVGGDRPDEGQSDSRTFQVQIFAEDVAPLTDAQRDEVRDWFHFARERLTTPETVQGKST